MSERKIYRLGLDIGTNTIGWACFYLKASQKGDGAKWEPVKLLDGGVLEFPDGRKGQKKETANTQRRAKRGRRKIVRARRWRLEQLRELLDKKLGVDVLSEAVQKQCPYAARFWGVQKPLDKEELARALYHLAGHRCFESNSVRLDDDDKNWREEEEALKREIKKFVEADAELEGNIPETPGVLYHLILQRIRDKKSCPYHGVRQKYRKKNEKWSEDHSYPPRATRRMIRGELEEMIKVQGNTCIDAETWDEIRDLVAEQRPLRAQEPGKCALEPEESRAPAALPTVARWRIWQAVHNLCVISKVGEEELDLEQKKKLVEMLEKEESCGYVTLRGAIQLKRDKKSELPRLRTRNNYRSPVIHHQQTDPAFLRAWDMLSVKAFEIRPIVLMLA